MPRSGMSAAGALGSAAAGPTHDERVHAAVIVAPDVFQAFESARKAIAGRLVVASMDKDVPDPERLQSGGHAGGVVRIERRRDLVGFAAGRRAVEQRMQVDLLIERVLPAGHLLRVVGDDDRILDQDSGWLIAEPAVLI